MKNVKEDLGFVNWLKAVERKLGYINSVIADSQQHQELDEQEVEMVKKLHDKLFWSGDIKFDRRNLDASKLNVQS